MICTAICKAVLFLAPWPSLCSVLSRTSVWERLCTSCASLLGISKILFIDKKSNSNSNLFHCFYFNKIDFKGLISSKNLPKNDFKGFVIFLHQFWNVLVLQSSNKVKIISPNFWKFVCFMSFTMFNYLFTPWIMYLSLLVYINKYRYGKDILCSCLSFIFDLSPNRVALEYPYVIIDENWNTERTSFGQIKIISLS